MSTFKWEAIDLREYLEVTTQRAQYHFNPGGYLQSAGGPAGDEQHPWRAEVMRSGTWKFLGAFHTGLEAKRAAIAALEGTPQARESK